MSRLGCGYTRWAQGVLLAALLADVAPRAEALFGDDPDFQALVEERNGSSAALVLTLAGSGAVGNADGSGKDASFWQPTDVALLPNQRAVMVADSRNHQIRSVQVPDTQTEGGDPLLYTSPWLRGVPTVSTLAGSGTNGYQVSLPVYAMPISRAGECFRADESNSKKIKTDKSNNKIRKVCVETGVVETLAGSYSSKGYQDGTNVTAKFREPSGVAFTPTGTTDLDDGSQLVLTMRARNVLMRSPFLTNPDPPGDALVIADSSNNRIRWLNLLTSQVSTLAGPRIKVNMCAFGTWQPSGGCSAGVCLCGNKNAVGPVSECMPVDWDINAVNPTLLCQYGSSNTSCTNPSAPTLDGCKCAKPNTGTECDSDVQCNMGGICLGSAGYADGTATNARFNNPTGVAVSGDGTVVYVADSNNHVLRRINIAAGIATAVESISGSPGSAGNEVGKNSKATLSIPKARFDNPTNVISSGNLILAQDSTNARVRAVSEEEDMADAVTGWLTCQDGSYISSGICYMLSKCLCIQNETDPVKARRCSDGSSAEDMPDEGQKPCTCTPANTGATCGVTKDCTGGGMCQTAARGDLDGHASRARFREPRGLDIDPAGSYLAIADAGNHKVRLVDCGGSCSMAKILLNRGGASAACLALSLHILISVFLLGR